MNFYRRMYRLGWLEPLTRDGPEGTYDYYVLLKEQAPLVRKLRLSVLYRDPVSGEILAVRGGGNPQP